MNILYFAALKEALKLSGEEIKLNKKISVRTLRQLLIDKHGVIFFPDNILCAINHELARDTQLISDDDEVAFYPPVTGG